jgi:protein-S-isoprenylcysteine O-methyltransferase Ste14
MFLSERMRHRPRPGILRGLGLLAFVPLALAAVMRAEPIESQIGEFWGGFYEVACIVLVLAGLGLRAAVAGCHALARDHLDASGVYSITRNPSYLANSLLLVGIMLSTQDVALAVASALWLAVYYERTILAEEARLFRRFGLAFVGWATLTPVFLPRLTGWRRPSTPFNLRAMLRRESSVWLGAAAALAAIALGSSHFGSEGLKEGWMLLLLAAGGIWAGSAFLSPGPGVAPHQPG